MATVRSDPPAVQAAFRSMERFAAQDEAVDFPGLDDDDDEDGDEEEEENGDEVEDGTCLRTETAAPTRNSCVGTVVAVTAVLAAVTIGGVVFVWFWRTRPLSAAGDGGGDNSDIGSAVSEAAVITNAPAVPSMGGSVHGGDSSSGVLLND